ncbi:hypothetical protein J8273_2697 [Carpediemonas membranifera]|uniref:Uncharacterized protein n=1 Tax=Carpediemonas membranifera TaxID=201153 RepID=A0A8J6EAZ4_9EUKA|nr:hypothetical protein J8273_2697 [Carpediemonas membranifera]|eukprot:KAG9395785.1 hypothetical protein J8273_2697 [Carpediemonas membranifera]
MNVELADGETLPDALHTLLQGTIWAIMMQAGANPDVDGIRKPANSVVTFKDEDSILWFLCKKLFFTQQVSSKECDICPLNKYVADYIYWGRFFRRRVGHDTTSGWRRVPRIINVFADDDGGDGIFLAVTPKGLWGWGSNYSDQLSIPLCREHFIAFPSPVNLHSVWAIESYEARLSQWSKHKAVKVISFTHGRTILVTPVGTCVAGRDMAWFTGANGQANSRVFMPVPMPQGFVPERIRDEGRAVIVTMGSHQMITGENEQGQLGLGHNEKVERFTPLPFWVDQLHTELLFNVFVSSGDLLVAGQAPRCLIDSGLLPASNNDCNMYLTATPLVFNGDVSRFFSDYDTKVVWVTIGQTNVWTPLLGRLTLPFKTTHFSHYDVDDCFRDTAGVWHRIDIGGGAAWSLVECQTPPEGFMVEIPPAPFD